MRIACPSCSAEYEVPDQALAAGARMLRCARCGHQFRAALPTPAEPATLPKQAAPVTPPPQPESAGGTAPDGAETPPAVTSRPPPSRGPTRSMPIDPPLPRLGDAPASPPDRFALAGWLLTVAALLVAAYAAYAWRDEIMAAWPPAARLFTALGLN